MKYDRVMEVDMIGAHCGQIQTFEIKWRISSFKNVNVHIEFVPTTHNNQRTGECTYHTFFIYLYYEYDIQVKPIKRKLFYHVLH